MAALNWVLLDHAAQAPVQIGDAVSAEAGGMPIYRVVGLSDGKALLDDERGGSQVLAPLDTFRWRAARAA